MNASTITQGQPELVSYMRLRRVVGILGVSMPIVLGAWGLLLLQPPHLLPSLSDYYGIRPRDAFVGFLFTISWFLYTYEGYDWRDNLAGTLAGIFGLGVALFPDNGPGLEPTIHYSCAAAMFLLLAYFSLALFTRTGGNPTSQKLVRNRVYRICGTVIVACIALMGLYKLAGSPPALARWGAVFWLETFSLWAFGFSWFVKGETFWKDVPRAAGPEPALFRGGPPAR
jgi:hypothetical protein